MAIDVNGKEVLVGSKVKVLYIDLIIWKYLPSEEQIDLQSMIGDICDVYEVSDQFASVEKWWDDGDGKSHCHCISLLPTEIELVI